VKLFTYMLSLLGRPFAIATLAFLLLVPILTTAPKRPPREVNMDRASKKLTPEEERVILHGDTEAPWSGRFVHHKQEGYYTCRNCDAALFRSSAKFDSGYGWPSFDQAIAGAVRQQADPDGMRTEIVCAACGGHLGHVFLNEGFTPLNTRHCVNSISMDFVPAERVQRAVFAAGCFWGVEYLLQRVPGVLETTVGYSGGRVRNPTYHQVCTTDTGHAEAVEVRFDPQKVSYEQLVKRFFELHDPAQENRQGPDVGPQYRSEIFYLDEEQRETAARLIEYLKNRGTNVATRLSPFAEFWKAEDYHQDYYNRGGGTPYCHFVMPRFPSDPDS